MTPKLLARAILFWIVSLILIALTASCGTTNKVLNKTSNETETKATEQVQNKTKVVITEVADTNVLVKGDTARLHTPLRSILFGKEVQSRSGATTIRAKYNKATDNIELEAITDDRSVAVDINKTTVSESETDSKLTSETNTETSTSDKYVKRDTSPGFWFWFWPVLIIVLVLVYLIHRYSPKF